MADFYMDNDIPTAVVGLLQHAGHHVVHTRDVNAMRAPDGDQLLRAARQHWILVTHNARDFILLHRAWLTWTAAWSVTERHEGILIIPQGPAPTLAQILTTALPLATPLANTIFQWDRNQWKIPYT